MNWKSFAALFVIVALGMVWQRVKVRTYERECGHLRQDIDRLRYENGRLDMQIHQWISPSHLDTIARQTYAMAPVKPAQQDILK
jgi:cell division protein FtsL